MLELETPNTKGNHMFSNTNICNEKETNINLSKKTTKTKLENSSQSMIKGMRRKLMQSAF